MKVCEVCDVCEVWISSGLTEGSFWELVIQGLGDFYHQPRIAKLQFGMAPYNRNMGMEVSERQTYDLAFEYDSIKMLLQRMLKSNLNTIIILYLFQNNKFPKMNIQSRISNK